MGVTTTEKRIIKFILFKVINNFWLCQKGSQ